MFNYYGINRNPKFTDIFPDLPTFSAKWSQVGLPMTDVCAADDPFVSVVYYSLYARYGNSTIAADDPERFTYGLMSICYNSGPTVRRKLAVQKELRDLSTEDLLATGITIANSAANPSQSPATTTDNILPFIDSQAVAKSKRGKLEALGALLALQDESIMYDFIAKFNRLFLTTPQPELPLLYAEED